MSSELLSSVIGEPFDETGIVPADMASERQRRTRTRCRAPSRTELHTYQNIRHIITYIHTYVHRDIHTYNDTNPIITYMHTLEPLHSCLARNEMNYDD